MSGKDVIKYKAGTKFYDFYLRESGPLRDHRFWMEDFNFIGEDIWPCHILAHSIDEAAFSLGGNTRFQTWTGEELFTLVKDCDAEWNETKDTINKAIEVAVKLDILEEV